MRLERRWLLAFTIVACGDSQPLLTSAGPISTTFPGPVETTAEALTTSSGGEGPGPISDAWMTGSPTASTSGEATTTTSDGGLASTTSTTTGDPLADCPRLRVMVPAGEVLNVRPSPSTAEEPVATLANGQLVETVAAVAGEAIDGNSLWYQIAGPDGFVFSGFVACTTDEPPAPPEGYFLPLTCGMSAKITQGNDGGVSHQGKDFYAFDFGLGLGTPLLAMADGTVHHIFDETGPGDPCYDGGGPECGPYGNLVVILHGDNTSSYYKHLNEVHVSLGQVVTRGQTIGLSGSTGYSTGPHAHVMRQENCGQAKCQSIALSFVECGVPTQGQTVTSMNCP
ncbi:peptidoglycan DD-metalloendopeptidase family protein [Nannocystis pusilla]|uniref:Peptidoglycan DD-metalloendopeptidase family protein n=1 Tax=Nannocystis pusilla TaxID=889268 RepID=A0A9X3ETA8_9BACT|nr:peptidoglycan DD-metalloendopeptidase family protein [Nannocystis pusilla]MCY1008895.1 peptidoglycan DD-metalloendopeptidase family protein [Nannocystis pusilla]